ncbi:MAG: hypothetical protein RMJ98_07765 [Myxococcales bacterium]|nr:hypothetical protein [Myxococcales bacterium]
MATANVDLILALRTTAERLREGADYAWTHLGACNCGHLAQTLTPYTREQIHRFALQRPGDWAEQAAEFCPESGLPIDQIFATMHAVGLSPEDIANLERLADRRVLQRLPPEVARAIDYRNRDHTIAYLHAWADLLEAELPPPPLPFPIASPPKVSQKAA